MVVQGLLTKFSHYPTVYDFFFRHSSCWVLLEKVKEGYKTILASKNMGSLCVHVGNNFFMEQLFPACSVLRSLSAHADKD